MGTRSDPDSWGESPRRLWEKRRKTGRCVEVVVVAWEQKLLDRVGRRLQSWAVGEMSEVEKEALMLRQAMAEADWDTVESHGRFNGIIGKILQWEQEDPVPKSRGSIDDFRLRGSRPCRRMHAPLKEAGWLIQVAHAFDNPNAPFSEGGALRRCGEVFSWKA